MFSDPLRYGGMNIRKPVQTAEKKFETSMFITENLTQIIKSQENDLSNYNEEEALERVKAAKAKKKRRNQATV